MPQKKKTISKKKIAGYNYGGAIPKETRGMKITNKQTNREDMFNPNTPANQKVIKTLNPESKKMYMKALKQNSQELKKGGGRGTGLAELRDLQTGGRKKEEIKKKLIESFLTASSKARKKIKK